MITDYKIFEATKDNYVLCVQAPKEDTWGQYFTVGKLYKTWKAHVKPDHFNQRIQFPQKLDTIRVKDDLGHFTKLNYYIEKGGMSPIYYHNSTLDVLFTKDKSMEDYQKRMTQQRFDL